jgi:hypothetical protein
VQTVDGVVVSTMMKTTLSMQNCWNSYFRKRWIDWEDDEPWVDRLLMRRRKVV